MRHSAPPADERPPRAALTVFAPQRGLYVSEHGGAWARRGAAPRGPRADMLFFASHFPQVFATASVIVSATPALRCVGVADTTVRPSLAS